MKIRDLRNAIKDLPDDMEVKLMINGGFVLSTKFACCDNDVDLDYNEIPDRKTLYIWQ